MNYAIIRYLLGWVLIFESCFLTLPCITAVIYQEREGFAFLAVLAFCLVLGMLLTARRPKRFEKKQRLSGKNHWEMKKKAFEKKQETADKRVLLKAAY